jgi:hypothetical protein
MNQFNWLIIGHLIGDFLFQTSWMAQYKATRWLPLLTHVTIYTLVVSLIGIATGGLTWLAIAVIFLSHVFLDRRTFVAFWVSKIQRSTGPESGWLGIVTDQIFHVIILAIAIWVTAQGWGA